MNPRERILAAIHHQPLDRFPTDIWATSEVWDKLCKHFAVTQRLELYAHLSIDGIFGVAPPYIGPATRNENGVRYDEWGMGYRVQEYSGGAYDEQVVYPLDQAETVADLETFPWPSPDWYDYSALPDLIAQYPERAIECGYTAIFYWHNRLRGLERSLADPLLHPDLTRYIIQRVSDFFTEYHRRCFEAGQGKLDITQVTDDFGSQNGLLISPRAFERYYRQPMQRAIKLAKSYGITVFHHDDGDMRLLLPRLVELGIDVLNPVQWRSGNWDLTDLKMKFGDRICFHGGVDNQHTLPFGTPEEVRAEVRWLKATLGRDRTGLIIAPCHNLQAITPVENIVAMYEEAARV
jgi:uroporphyrinogen decarboxylase